MGSEMCIRDRTNIEGVDNFVKNLFSEPWIHFLKVDFDLVHRSNLRPHRPILRELRIS